MGRITLGISRAGRAVRARVVTGLAVIAPLALTVWVVLFLFRRIDGILQPLIFRVIDRHIPGVGILATLILLYLIGLLVHALGFRSLFRWTERLFLSLPGIRDVYGSSKTIMDTLTNPSGAGFRRVVTVEYPRRGVRVVGFVTNEVTRPDGTRELAVFLPTTPNPTSGFVFFLSPEEVEATEMTVEEGLKLVVSGGVVLTRRFRTPWKRPGPVEGSQAIEAQASHRVGESAHPVKAASTGAPGASTSETSTAAEAPPTPAAPAPAGSEPDQGSGGSLAPASSTLQPESRA